MKSTTDQKSFFGMVDAAVKLSKTHDADGLLILLEQKVAWKRLKRKLDSVDAGVLATHSSEIHEAAQAAEISCVLLEMPEATVQNQLTQGILLAVTEDILRHGSTLIAVYSNFDTEEIDSISVLRLTERLGRLTARDLRRLKTKVPLETLKVVVDLAVSIGREGREGKAVGTMFVVGDHRKVLDESRPAGFDPVKGYAKKERSLHDSKTREGIKEIAQLDGMFVVSSDGTVEGCGRLIDTSPVELTISKGLGSRHFAGAAISKNTKAIAVVVSQSSGTVRIFQNGEVVLRIEPLQRKAMKWKELDPETTVE